MAGYVVDGQVVNNTVQLIVSSETLNDDFIQGNDKVKVFILNPKFSSTLTSLRCFPELKTFIVRKTDAVVDLNPNIFDGTKVLTQGKIYVANSLLAAYKTAYPSWENNFESWTFQVNFEIPYVGETQLTPEYVEAVVALASGSVFGVNKITIPNDFTSYAKGAFDAIFELFENLVFLESPWVNGEIGEELSLTITPYTAEWSSANHTGKLLTSEYVASFVEESFVGKITKVIMPSGFDDYGNGNVFGTIDQTGADNLFATPGSLDALSPLFGGLDLEINDACPPKVRQACVGLGTDGNFRDVTFNMPYWTFFGRDKQGSYKLYCRTLSIVFNHKQFNSYYMNGALCNLFADKYIFKDWSDIKNYGTCNTYRVGNLTLYFKTNGFDLEFINSEVIQTDQNTIFSLPNALFARDGGPGGDNIPHYIYRLKMDSLTMNLRIKSGNWVYTCDNLVIPDILALMDVATDYSSGTQHTLTIGQNRINALLNYQGGPEALQSFYDKNWILTDPAPSAFTFAIGSDTYSCDFGMTWTQWVASAYNTAGFTVSNNKVYDSNNQVVQKNGSDVADTDMVRYGDSYTLASTTPVLSDLTNTTWLLNSTVDVSGSFWSYYINFVSKGQTYAKFYTDESGARPDRTSLWYATSGNNVDEACAKNGTEWGYTDWRTIGITGGTDATDATLIAWLQANATQVQGHAITVTYQGIYSCDVYDGQDSTGTLLASLDSNGNDTATVVCSSGYIFAGGIGSLSITGANGATSDNPSTVSANGATITVVQTGSGGG